MAEQLQRYRCHKIVAAGKVVDVERYPDGSGLLVVKSRSPLWNEAVPVSYEYMKKHKPLPGGYFVEYEDGYASWSPAEAFEAGYTRIEEDPMDHDERYRQETEEVARAMQPPQGSAEEVGERFRYKAPSAEGAERHGRLTSAFRAVADEVLALVPEGRERSVVLTKLEEAKMWASAGVARNPETR